MSESHSVIMEMSAALIPIPAPGTQGDDKYHRLHKSRPKIELTDDADNEPRLRRDKHLANLCYRPSQGTLAVGGSTGGIQVPGFAQPSAPF